MAPHSTVTSVTDCYVRSPANFRSAAAIKAPEHSLRQVHLLETVKPPKKKIARPHCLREHNVHASLLGQYGDLLSAGTSSNKPIGLHIGQQRCADEVGGKEVRLSLTVDAWYREEGGCVVRARALCHLRSTCRTLQTCIQKKQKGAHTQPPAAKQECAARWRCGSQAIPHLSRPAITGSMK